jgi:hypothetical protein
VDIARRILRPEPKMGKDGPTITYGLLTVEDRSRAMQFATPAPIAAPKQESPMEAIRRLLVEAGKIGLAEDARKGLLDLAMIMAAQSPPHMEPPPPVEIDQDLYGRAVAALVLRSVEGAEVDGEPLTWTCGLPLEQMVGRLDGWPLRWLLKLIRVATEDSELDPEEERGA